MSNNKRFLLSVFWVVLGVVLLGCGAVNMIDQFWSSMGGAFVAVGIMQVVRHIRYRTNEEYKEKCDTEIRDERNKFLSNKAWAWAGYWFVMIAALSVIPLKLLGHEELMMMASGSVCLILVLYWASYMILRKKY